MPNQSVKKLDESQLKNFDWEFVDEIGFFHSIPNRPVWYWITHHHC